MTSLWAVRAAIGRAKQRAAEPQYTDEAHGGHRMNNVQGPASERIEDASQSGASQQNERGSSLSRVSESDLVEAAARATYEQTEVSHNGVATTWDIAGSVKRNTYRRLGGIALASTGIPLDRLAKLASGEAWIAPMEMTDAMQRAGNPREGAHYVVGDPSVVWAAMRDTYLNIPIAMRDRYLTPDEPKL